MSELIDTAGIAELLGMTREHVTDRVTKRPDFPRPALNISQRARRWRAADVKAWAGLAQESSAAMSDAVSR